MCNATVRPVVKAGPELPGQLSVFQQLACDGGDAGTAALLEADGSRVGALDVAVAGALEAAVGAAVRAEASAPERPPPQLKAAVASAIESHRRMNRV